MNNIITNKLYELTRYDGAEITTRRYSHEDKQLFNPHAADHNLFFATGLWTYHGADGQWVTHFHGHWPCLGKLALDIIRAAQINVGEFLSPADIADLVGGKAGDINNWLSTRWLAIRKAHGEMSPTSYFFLSRRAGGFAVAWHPERTWQWLERVPAERLINPPSPTK